VHLVLLVPCISFWGAAEGALFVGFSMALVSFYLSLAVFFIEGFPFTGVFKPAIGKSINAVFLIMLVPILVAAVFQWLCFRSAALVLGATIVLAVSAYSIAHFSLGKLENRIRLNLTMLGFTPSAMFKELE
jgi:hypothetical protein